MITRIRNIWTFMLIGGRPANYTVFGKKRA